MQIKAKCLLLLGLTVVATSVVFCLRPIAQEAGYHDFADRRMFWGIPNCWHVLSNFPFVVVGVVGRCGLGDHVTGTVRLAGAGPAGGSA